MDPLSITSGLIAIVTATVQSSQALYQTVQSFRNHQTTVKQLIRELNGLNGVLESLKVHVDTDETVFLPLKFPLVQCCQACRDFRLLVVKCSRRSTRDRTSFRDWAKLSFMNGDIAGFTNMLAGYKATINIALGDANLRSQKVTLQVLNEYKDMIHDTMHDLETHLSDINLKLQSPASQNSSLSPTENANLQRIENDRDSTERCLKICSQFLKNINTLRFQPVSIQPPTDETTQAGLSAQDLTFADAITLSTMKTCSTKLSETISELQTHRKTMETTSNAVVATSPPGDAEGDTEGDPELSVQRLRGELDSTKQRLAFCERAAEWASSGRVHVVENITVGNNGKQVCVSTLGDLFHIKGAVAGDGGFQFFGTTTEEGLRAILKSQNRRQSAHSDELTVSEVSTSGGGSSSAI